MDGPQPQQSRVDINLSSDYISNLPADIKERILVKLSLEEAVRTSILSSRWKDLWITISILVLKEKLKESKLMKLGDTVLLVDQGLIKKFKLVSKHACNEKIGWWMLVLSTNKIEHLDLVFNGDACVIPSRFFSCNALKSVRLSGCSINVPQFFNDFTLLHTLHLSNFNLSGFGVEKLVSSCPLLEHLELHSFVQQGCLRILAPNLTFLDISGDFDDICLETPKLAVGSICLITEYGDYQKFSVAKHRKESNVTCALGCLSNIQKLEICGEFIDYLAMGPIRENLPAIFHDLTEIFVDLRICPDEIATALCLFQKAPNLKVLHIELRNSNGPPLVQGLWESKAIRDCLFKCLEVVNIIYDHDLELSLRKDKSMLEFAELVLSTAPQLEEFNFYLGNATVVFEELKFFPRLSENCKIVLDEESDDDA